MKKTLFILVSLSLNATIGYAEEVKNTSTKVLSSTVAEKNVAVVNSEQKSNTDTVFNNKHLPNSLLTETIQQKEFPHSKSIGKLLIKTNDFYRIKKKKRGVLTIVQDFYSIGEKRTDPYAVTDIKKAEKLLFTNIDYEDIGINGLFISWFQNGQIEQKGVFDQGFRKGLWVAWYANGQKKAAGFYQNGLKEGQWTTWYQNGKRMQKGIYHDGKREGVWIFWYGNGKKKEAGRYSDDKRVERWSYWNESGKMIKNDLVDDEYN